MISEIFREATSEAAPLFFGNYSCFFKLVCVIIFFAIALSFVNLLAKVLYSRFIASLPLIYCDLCIRLLVRIFAYISFAIHGLIFIFCFRDNCFKGACLLITLCIKK